MAREFPNVVARISEVQSRVDQAAREIADLRVPNKRFGTYIYGLTVKAFDAQGKAEGWEPWAPLLPATIVEKNRIGKEVPLVRTGELRTGFVPESGENPGVGNTVRHARYFEEGTDTMPRRQLLPSREFFLKTALKVYNQYVGEVTRRANG